MQKQMLWHSFQEKNKQLELQHKLQLEHKYQVLTQTQPPKKNIEKKTKNLLTLHRLQYFQMVYSKNYVNNVLWLLLKNNNKESVEIVKH